MDPDQSTPAGPPRPKRVLVVDDEPLILNAVRRILSRTFEVQLAHDADEADALLAGGARFDLILCDLMMPGRTGRGLYEMLGARDPEAAARVAFMTGGTVDPEMDRFLRESGRPRIDKPFASSDLRALALRLTGGERPPGA